MGLAETRRMGLEDMRRWVGLDACVLINLVASGIDLNEVCEASSSAFCITEVVARETYSLLAPDQGSGRTLVDVQELVQAGSIESVRLEAADLNRYVALAAELDDGEASVIALAENRGWPVSTDDRRAGRVVVRLGLDLIGTPSLIRAWESGGSIETEVVGEALFNIEARARYTPRKDDPNRRWWVDRIKARCQ